MVKIYRDADGDLSVLRGRTIGVVGYGNQGRAQGMNMRDSGLKVIVGNIRDSSWDRAVDDGFDVHSIDEAAELSDIILLLLPDEVQKEVYEMSIRDRLKDGKTLIFAHGYNIHYGFIVPPANVNVVLLAPRMIGMGVRELFLNGSGAPAFIAVHQDASGRAKSTVLAIAKAIGATKGGVIESTFAEETEIDHFLEQATWPAVLRILTSSYEVLVEAGYAPEIVCLELYGSGEAAEVFKAMATIGLFRQMELHSRTSQYGQLSRAKRMISDRIKTRMIKALEEIKLGLFAREWEGERQLGYPVFNRLRERAFEHPLNRVEDRLRKEIHQP